MSLKINTWLSGPGPFLRAVHHGSKSVERNIRTSVLFHVFSIPFFFHLNIIKGFIMTESFNDIQEKPKGCLMWTSRMWLLLTQEGSCFFSKYNNERARGNGFYQIEMIYALFWGWISWAWGRLHLACWFPIYPSFSCQLKWHCLGEAFLGNSQHLGQERLPFRLSTEHPVLR